MTPPRRILILNWRFIRHPQAGGAEINIYEQARCWVQEGHKVTLICANPGRKYLFEKEEIVDGIYVRRMGNRFTVYLLALIYYMLNRNCFDRIVDISNGIPFFTPLLAKIPGILIVHHVHGKQWFKEFPFPIAVFGWFLESRIVPLLYHKWPVIAVSPTTRDALVKIGFKPSMIHIVYNGVRWPSCLLARAFSDGPRVVYVGRIKRYKRIDRLVKAVADLCLFFPNIHLDLAGDGDAIAEIENLVKELDIQDHVTIYGYVDEEMKNLILSSATVFATPSMQEGWGLSVIEANAYGIPAVAYNVPGLNVSIRHGETGLLASDDQAFREALATVITDRDLHKTLSIGAIKWASKFNWESSAKATLEVMESWRSTEQSYRNK